MKYEKMKIILLLEILDDLVVPVVGLRLLTPLLLVCLAVVVLLVRDLMAVLVDGLVQIVKEYFLAAVVALVALVSVPTIYLLTHQSQRMVV
jgi:hypothetical protein